ncbi:MAG: hypothetical protein QOD06_1975 [Candidatus Binatota bacterium]|nr:hypothetical protein [Candidatus Binatota bacterium]
MSRRAPEPKKPKTLRPSRSAPVASDGRTADRRRLAPDLPAHRTELERQTRQMREARRQLRREHARFQEIYDRTAPPHLVLDRDGCIRTLNKPAERLLGVDRGAVTGQPFLALVSRRHRSAFVDHMRRCRDGEAEVLTTLGVRTGDGRNAVQLVSYPTDRNSEPESFRTLISDVSQLQRQEMELVQAQEARREAEEAERLARADSEAKDRFLAFLSHELRTPLTPVLATVSGLLDHGDLPDELRSALDRVHRNVQIEARLIDDLLDVSRISHGRLVLERRPCDVHEILRQVAADTPAGTHVSLDLKARRSRVDGDAVRLRQVFANLVSNAIHAAPVRGPIAIRTTNVAGRMRIQVTDSGRGIDSTDIERVFEPFFRAAQGGDASSHLGLGLAIARGLVEAHEGRIEATSAGTDRGATFAVELPSTNQAIPAATNTKPDRSTRPATVLLVEDHADTAAALSDFLTLSGYRTLVARSRREALAMASERWDVLVCDLGLPDGNGFDLLGELSADRPVKAIALSGYGSDADRSRSRTAGFTAHLTKPVTVPALRDAIARLVAGGS